MPQIPVASSLGYVGVFLLLAGFFLLLTGLNIVQIEKITVTPGSKTWGFGVILAVLGIVFLALDVWVPPQPSTPTPIAEVPTPTATSTHPTNTPVPPTHTPTSESPTDTPTPKPPTDTPTPKPPTDMPEPTDIPAPTPTATIDADPTVYDNFNNPAFDGSFNQDLWFYQNLEFSQIAQHDGALIVTRNRNSANTTGLNARKYHFLSLSALTAGSGMFFEAKLKLSSEERNGNVNMQLYSDLPGGPWWTQCTIGNDGEQEQVACNTHPQNYVAVGKWDDYATWHTFRIEVDSSRMIFNYYLDGQMVGSVPIDTESLRNASFRLGIGVHGTNVTGYIDDVRIGQTGQ